MASETEIVQRILSAYEAQESIVRAFYELSKHDRARAHILLGDLHLLVGRNGGSKTPAKPAQKGGTNFARVARVLMAKRNDRTTKADLGALCDLTKHAVHALIYTTNKDDFESKRNFDGKAAGFRLTVQGLEKASELME